MGGFILLVLIIIFVLIFSKSNNNGGTASSVDESQKAKLYNSGEAELIQFVRANPRKIKEYFKFVSSKGTHRSYTDIFETRDFNIEVSFDDDSFQTRISIIKKSNGKVVIYLVS